MGGSTINNWGKFNHNVFKGISGVGGEKIAELQRSKNGGVLASRVAEVKESHVHASTVKKFFLGLITFGIYNICHGISAKNQRATQAALKQGVDNVHGALSYLSIMAQRDVQRHGAGGNAKLSRNSPMTSAKSWRRSRRSSTRQTTTVRCR